MAYFIVSASLTDPLPVSKEDLTALEPGHKEFILRGVRDNRVLCAGPKKSGNGGFIVVKAETKASLEDYISTDPWFQKGIQRYDITEFTPYDWQEYLTPWMDRS
jgi:uncharacterized protein YciI